MDAGASALSVARTQVSSALGDRDLTGRRCLCSGWVGYCVGRWCLSSDMDLPMHHKRALGYSVDPLRLP